MFACACRSLVAATPILTAVYKPSHAVINFFARHKLVALEVKQEAVGASVFTFVHSIITRFLMRFLELLRVVLLYRDVLDGLTARDHRLSVDVDDIVRWTTLCGRHYEKSSYVVIANDAADFAALSARFLSLLRSSVLSQTSQPAHAVCVSGAHSCVAS